jgi:hypothetical protein
VPLSAADTDQCLKQGFKARFQSKVQSKFQARKVQGIAAMVVHTILHAGRQTAIRTIGGKTVKNGSTFSKTTSAPPTTKFLQNSILH